MRIILVLLIAAAMFMACTDDVMTVRDTDGEEAIALAIIDALTLQDYETLAAVMVSPEDIAAKQKQLSKSELADSTTQAQASWQMIADTLPRDLASARETFAAALGEGIDAGIDWEAIEYAGYSGNLRVMRGEPARFTDFEVYFMAGDQQWTFFVPRLQQFGKQWKITGFHFRLYDKTGAPPIDPDSWDEETTGDDSWEVTEETTSE
ncbi:MAG: hypothetical protein K8R90_02335 [Candidatus Cloacimonetes bacterium]|nr:hypothetical protein [Candidatus Cloacimonadota bacterium]